MFRVLSVLFCLPLLAWARADFSAWKDSTRIFINTTPAGANISKSVVLFPLLVRLDANSLPWDKVRSDGADLRFADPDGSLLAHEVELFNASAKQAAIWVRVPVVDSLSATDHIVMYWNNPGAASVSSGAAVFDTAWGYAGVWHFGEDQAGVGTKDLYKDATRNANHGDDFVSAARSNSIIGFGQGFDGMDDRIQVDNSPSVALGGPVSVSAWVKASSITTVAGNANVILRKGDANPNSYQLCVYNQHLAMIFDAEDGQGVQSKAVIAPGQYYHVAATWESKSVRVYINGVQDTIGYTVGPTGTLSKDARPLYLGGRTFNPNDASSKDIWDGDIDEVRLARTAHTPQHIKLSYESQKPGSGILTFVPFPPPVSIPSKEDLSLWPKSRKIFLNTTDQGAAVAGAVAGFPLLVRLDTSRFKFSEALSGGRDIRFSDPDGTVLPHSIERWDATAGKAEIWVRVPKVDGNSGTDHVRMHWGNVLAPERNSPAGVFDTADGFVGVWHLDKAESGIPGAASYMDQTAYGHHAKDYAAAAPAPADGHIGLGQAFGGTWDRLQVASTDRLAFRDSLTFSAWIRGTAWDQAVGVVNPILRKGEASPNTYQLAIANGRLALFLDDTDDKGIRGNTELATNRWYHVAATWGGGKANLYVDGKPDLAAPVARAAPILKDSRSFFIGGRDSAAVSASNDQFTGMLDEVQVAGPARSADWIKLAYENQRSDSRLLAFEGLPKDTVVIPVDTVPKDTTKPVTPSRKAWTLDTTLVQGGEIKDSVFTILNTGPADIRVVITPAGDSVAQGVIGVQAIFRFIQVGGEMPSVIMIVDTAFAAGRSLYQLLPGVDGSATLGDWGSAEGSHEIFYPGSYILGKDTTLPRLRILDQGVEGDSSWASVMVEDNIKHVFIKCFATGTEATLLSQREHSGIPFRLAFKPLAEPVPLKILLSVDDGRQQTAFPPSPASAYALARSLADLEAPVSAKSPLQWGLYGLPVRPLKGRTLDELAKAAGTERLYGAVWTPDPEDMVRGDYRMLGPEDTLPAGTGIWLAGETPFTALPMGEARSFAQGSSMAYALRLSRGWNLITSPALEKLPWAVSKRDLSAYDQSPVKGLHAHFAEDQYADADTLEPWKGYFVYSRADTVLELTPEGPALRKPSLPKMAGGKTAFAGSAGPAIQVFLEPLPGKDGRLPAPVALRLGAAAYASDALAAEDEFMPASPSRGISLGASRSRRGLRTDLLGYRPGGVHAWKLAWGGRGGHSGGRPVGGRLRVSRLDLPEGMEMRAMGAFAATSFLVEEGASLEISGEASDTLVLWAAPKGSWKEGDPVPGLSPRPAARSLAFRDGPDGGYLWLALPDASALRVRAHGADGRRLASVEKGRLAPGYHAIPLAPAGSMPRGLLFVTVEFPGSPDGYRTVLKVLRP